MKRSLLILFIIFLVSCSSKKLPHTESSETFVNLYEITKPYDEGTLWCSTRHMKMKVGNIWAQGEKFDVIFKSHSYFDDKYMWVSEPFCSESLKIVQNKYPYYKVVQELKLFDN